MVGYTRNGEYYLKNDLKRKRFSAGKNNKFKRFKRTPKYIRENPENILAKEKEKERDVYNFSDSDIDDGNDLGMGLELSDLAFLDDHHKFDPKDLITLTQDSVRPLFCDETSIDEAKLDEGLGELNHKSFRTNQKETVTRILLGRSTLFISPTGSGKSLCYLLPALLYWRYNKFITIVVSPLISLMEDQLINFPSCLTAVSIHSGHSSVQRRNAIEKIVKGEAQVIFISPEAIVGGLLSVDDLKNLPPVGFVCIDEAHCLSEWSHNFRPAYLQFFKILNEQMNIKTYLGLTATATKATSLAIAEHLLIDPKCGIIGSTTIPDNLLLSVSMAKDKDRGLIELLRTNAFIRLPSIVVYCNRREDTEKIAGRIRTGMQDFRSIIEAPERKKAQSNVQTSNLNDSSGSNTSTSCESERKLMTLKWTAEAYHAGLSTDTKKKIQHKFIKGEIRVVVATVAFGMGINKSNVRAIIHYDMPKSFENYVQEIGRAGRDGKVAQCHMFMQSDRSDLYYQMRNAYASTVEFSNLKKLTDYLFKPCRCFKLAKKDDLLELERLNVLENTKSNKGEGGGNISPSEKENSSSVSKSSISKTSVVRKHRTCRVHEIAFPVEEATEATDLWAESLMSLVGQLQKAYPQLKIKLFNPTKSICNLVCHKGKEQMDAIAKKSQPVGTALVQYMSDLRKQHSKMACETPTRLSFDVVAIADKLTKPSAEVIRMLKQLEWELVEKTGRFRRSQVRVNMEGNSFHMEAVRDLNDQELDEINNFLLHASRSYANEERSKIERVFSVFKSHSISVDKMDDKKSRLDTSGRLKSALKAYFLGTELDSTRATVGKSVGDLDKSKLADNHDHDDDEYQLATAETNCELSAGNRCLGGGTENNHQLVAVVTNDTLHDCGQAIIKDTAELCETKNDKSLAESIEMKVRKDARTFLATNHGDDYTARTVAKIFQGVSTPRYRAEHWAGNRKWWRCHLDIDFPRLMKIIDDEIFRERDYRASRKQQQQQLQEQQSRKDQQAEILIA